MIGNFQSQPPAPPPNFSRGPPSTLDDYSRGGGPPDFDPRSGGSGPPNKRPRVDPLNDGHWANAPTDRQGPGFPPVPPQAPHWRQNPNDPQSNSRNMVDDSLDETLTAARHGVSPFFQTATDEEMRGFNRTMRVFQK